jgi:hypothetical protein
MFERVIIDITELQSDLSSAEACEDTSEEDQAIANRLWDMLEVTLEQVYKLERKRTSAGHDDVMYEAR